MGLIYREFGTLLGERALVRRWRGLKLGHEVLPERDCRSETHLRGVARRDVEFRGQTVPAAQVHAALMSALGFAYATVVTTDEYLAG